MTFFPVTVFSGLFSPSFYFQVYLFQKPFSIDFLTYLFSLLAYIIISYLVFFFYINLLKFLYLITSSTLYSELKHRIKWTSVLRCKLNHFIFEKLWNINIFCRQRKRKFLWKRYITTESSQWLRNYI